MKKIKYTKHVTSKGLKILNFYDPSTKRVGIEFLTKASTSINPNKKSGLAHFVEHLLARQSKNFPTKLKKAIALEEMGASSNAFTGFYETGYHVSGGIQDFEKLLYILSDTVLNPHITNESLTSEKSVIEKEIIRMEASDGVLASEKLHSILYMGSPLSYPIGGKIAELNNITKADVFKFMKKNYLANNSMVVVWGGMKDKEVFSKIKKSFEILNKGDWKNPEFDFSRSKYQIFTKKETPQVSMHLVFRLPKNPKIEHIAKLTRMLLCSGWTSRIPARLRTKESLIYTWHASFDVSQDTARLSISLGTSPKSFNKMLKILAEEIVKFREKGVSKSELELVKKTIIKPYVWNMERAGNYANWYIDQYFFDEEIESPEQYIKNIERVTKKEVLDFAQKYLTKDNWYMSVVGDIKEEPKLEI